MPGGKNRHSQDRLFITATEWRKEYGGKKVAVAFENQVLPFDQCALAMSPYETPCCTPEGVLFDFVNLVPYIRKHKANPVSGVSMTTQEIIRLNMAKNADGLWHCPVTCKVFNNNSHVVAIKTTGNVFSYEAVHELNIKAKQFSDLLSGDAFKRSDIITLQNPNDPEHMALRDVSNFKHLQTLREDSSVTRAAEGPIRHTPSSESVMREIEKKRIADENAGIKRKIFTITDVHVPTEEEVADISEFWALKPSLADVNPGSTVMEHKVSCSLTSSSAEIATSSSLKLASPVEIREARWKAIRKLGKKGYVQLQTSLGNINIEVHCNFVPCTSWNFLTLCQKGYYDGLTFHRVIPGFMAQTGDPTGKGNGGESAFPEGEQFRDEYDSRLTHDKRGVISMANSGVNTNGSQFFITFKATKHLDLKHSIFGTVVGGAATLDRIEEIEIDPKSNRPIQEVKIIQAIVLQSPLEEADSIMMENVKLSIKSRKSKDLSALPNQVQREAKVVETVSSLQNAALSVDYGEVTTHSGAHSKKPKLTSGGFKDFSGW